MAGLYLYIAEFSDASYYTGVTNNLDIRDWIHNHDNDNRQAYTYSRRPVRIVFSDFFRNPEQAIQAEKRVKGWSRRKKRALIQGRFDLIHELAKCTNASSHRNHLSDARRSPFDSAQDDRRDN